MKIIYFIRLLHKLFYKYKIMMNIIHHNIRYIYFYQFYLSIYDHFILL